MPESPDRTPDGRWILVGGRRWRAADPELPDDVRAELQHHLGRARATVRTARAAGDDDAVRAARHRVGLAKHGLGERGQPWWEQDDPTRRRRWRDALDALSEGG
jgi:uncharacterized protein